MRRIIIETGHPGQVHQFKHLANKLQEAGHRVLFVAKEKEITRYLLETYGLAHDLLSKPGKGLIQKVFQLPRVYYNYAKVIRNFKPDIILSRFSLQSSHLAFLLRITHIAYTDTEHVKRLDAFTVPFVRTKISANSYQRDFGMHHYRFPGNTELFYLHPKRFTPDEKVLPMLGVAPGEPYAILRFVSWQAHHDIGKRGLSSAMKEQLVNTISLKMKVFITSEEALPSILRPFQFHVPPEMMHDALAFASLYVGEGGTMASEAAMVGTPAIYINPLQVGYVEDEAKAGLVVSLRDESTLMENLQKMLDDPLLKAHQLMQRDRYLQDMIDPTDFYFWLINEHPVSLRTLNSNPHIADSFQPQQL